MICFTCHPKPASIMDLCADKDKRHTMMFSATFRDDIQELAKEYLYDYIWVGVGRIGGAVDTVQQSLVKVEKKDKANMLAECLTRFLDNRSTDENGAKNELVMVFTNSKNTCRWLDETLYDMKFDMCALHGDLTQAERETSIGKFRNRETDILVCTDVASRGIDV